MKTGSVSNRSLLKELLQYFRKKENDFKQKTRDLIKNSKQRKS